MTLPVLNLPLLSAKRPKPYLKVKKLHLWLLALPVGNTKKAAQLILQQLKDINEYKYPYNERMQLLDLMRPAIRQILIALKHPLRQAPLPLSQDNRITARMIQDLLAEFAKGYKLITSELMVKTRPKENDTLLLRESIYLSIQYLARQVVESYQVYASPQYDVWRELHQLFRYAEYHEIQHHPIDDPYPDYSLPIHYTIDLVYKRIVLLSLAAPYHLMQNEAEDIYYLVSAWTSACHISEMDKKSISNQYGVDFATDMSPRYIPESLEWEPVDGRIIDISEVRARLNKHLKRVLRANLDDVDLEHETSTLVERQQRDMLLRLSDAWQNAMERQEQREDRGAHIRLAIGLNACHFYCSNKASFTPEIDELRITTRDDSAQRIIFANAYREAIRKDRKHEVKNYPTNPWQQRNISQAGIALKYHEQPGNLSVKVGEIVCYLFESHTGNRWHIGVIRWLHIDNNNQVDMGLMNLANTAVSVAVKAIEGVGKGTDYFRSLMIPKQVSIQQLRSLILPANLYDVGTVLSINMKTRLFYVKLSRLLISSRTIAVFEFDVLEQPPVDVNAII